MCMQNSLQVHGIRIKNAEVKEAVVKNAEVKNAKIRCKDAEMNEVAEHTSPSNFRKCSFYQKRTHKQRPCCTPGQEWLDSHQIAK